MSAHATPSDLLTRLSALLEGEDSGVLAKFESDSYLDLVWEVQRSDDIQIDRLIYQALRSRRHDHRAFAATVLAQLHLDERTDAHRAANLAALFSALWLESVDLVRARLVEAIAFQGEPSAGVTLARLVNDPSVEVRGALAASIAFSCVDDPQIPEEIVDALIQLSSDVAYDVRDWAVASLGSLIEIDNRKVRDALFVRLLDEGSMIDDETEIAAEAALGLAVRGDSRLPPFLDSWLESSRVAEKVIRASGVAQHPGGLEALRRLRKLIPDNDPRRRELELAIGKYTHKAN